MAKNSPPVRAKNTTASRAAEPDNTIEVRSRERKVKTQRPERAAPAEPKSPDNTIRPSGPRRVFESPRAAPSADAAREETIANPRNAAVPESVAQRFVQVGRKYYFPDGEMAFKDRGTRLTTQSENAEVIASLLEIARARDWDKVTVNGSERFRREAWFQATRAGLTVRGYRPSAVEQAQLVRQMDRRREARAPEAPESSPEPSPDVSAKTAVAQERVVQGRLLAYGAAPYQFDRREPDSYYVKLDTKEGERVLWGRDLERAIGRSLSQVAKGDEVAVRQVGERPVTVMRPQRDEEGRITGQEAVSTYRNRWIVEKAEFLSARAGLAKAVRDPQADPKSLVRERPELAGTLLELRAAELVAKEAYADARDQARFVARVREALATEIERGEALSAVRVRPREAQRDAARPRPIERTQTRVLA